MSDLLDFSTILDTSNPVTYQSGDYPASIYVVTSGDQPGFGSDRFGHYGFGVGRNLPALNYIMKGYYRSGSYTFYYPWTNDTYFSGKNDFTISTLLKNSSINRTKLELNTLDGVTQSIPNPDPSSIGIPDPEPGSPWEDPSPEKPKPSDPDPNDPGPPDDWDGTPLPDPYPFRPLDPVVPG